MPDEINFVGPTPGLLLCWVARLLSNKSICSSFLKAGKQVLICPQLMSSQGCSGRKSLLPSVAYLKGRFSPNVFFFFLVPSQKSTLGGIPTVSVKAYLYDILKPASQMFPLSGEVKYYKEELVVTSELRILCILVKLHYPRFLGGWEPGQ